jgi:hypothetical protein
MDAALGPAIAAVDRFARRIIQSLATLRDEHGVAGLTVPRA